MILTRAVDNRLKAFFNGSEVRHDGVPFQGKGFRSLGQEAIYAAAIRLKRGAAFRGADGSWQGDVVAPIIRDVGAALAMRPEPATVRMVLNGQMAKAGPPMDGRDLHVGDFDWGILPATAPLSISSLTAAGMGLAFGRAGHERVAVSFIGEGGSSLGEWHEAINLCATAPIAGDLLSREQPDGAVHAGPRQLGGPHVRRQGRWLRYSRPDDRRHRSRRHRRGVHVGRGACACR